MNKGKRKFKTVRIPKKALYQLSIIFIIIVASLAYSLFYMPAQQQEEEVNGYKRALFESTLCQYSCPLSTQELQGIEQELPERECINQCITTLREGGYNDQFLDRELLNDELVQEIERTIKDCKLDSTDFDEGINNVDFFNCASESLDGLKNEFEYLN